MATPQLAAHLPAARPLLDRWTQVGISLVVAPLILWGAVSVFMLAWACGVPWYVAWVPAVSTSGVMVMSSRLAMRNGLDPHIKRWATYLTVAAVLIEMVVAGLQHALPTQLHPPAVVMFLIGCLPTAMGGATYKVWGLTAEAQEAAIAAAAQAQLDAVAHRQELADQEATQLRITAAHTAADDQRRARELAHARELAELTRQAATAEQAKAAAAQTVANAVSKPQPPQRPHLVPPPEPAGPVDALGRPARPSPKRDAALRWLIDACHAGRDLTAPGIAAEIDRAIGANAYARKHLAKWITDVQEYVAKGAA